MLELKAFQLKLQTSEYRELETIRETSLAYESRYILSDIKAATRENRSSGFPTRSDTNRPVQFQKTSRRLKFRFYEEEKLYYPCSENKGADQLRSYCEADLRLCFRIGKNPVFSRRGS